MRRRLLASTLGVVVVAVLTLGIPLGVVGARLIRNQAQQRVERDARNVAVAVEDRLDAGRLPDADLLRRLAPAGTAVRVTDVHRRSVVAGPRLSGHLLSATVATPDGAAVQASSSYDPVGDRVTGALLVVAGLVVLAGGLAVALAVAQARRLAEPLVELELSAKRLGAGDFRSEPRRSGVPEIDRVADVLDASGTRIRELLRHEREFASDASHQLRTPLTALQMRLEEILHTDRWPTVRAEAGAALAQAERLTGVVEQLLAAARSSRAGTVVPTDVDATVRSQVAEWAPAYERVHRRVALEDGPAQSALATPGTLAQALATLLDNALRHGAGAVTVRPRTAGEYVRIEVEDEGAGVPPALAPRIFERTVSGDARGTGLGLALARALVEADGGRLELVHTGPGGAGHGSHHTTFAVFLPAG